ncbi:hypothetical protein PFISCL1PPCAC_25073, partial [Pristionchus fissidentatus]
SNTNDLEWKLTLAYKKDLKNCVFSIDNFLTFNCEAADSGERSYGGVLVTRIEEGLEGTIIFQQYSIKPAAGQDDSIIDTLKLYEKEFSKMSMALKIGNEDKKIESGDITFFEKCVVTKPIEEGYHKLKYAIVGQSFDQPPNIAHNEYTCKTGLSAFLNDEHVGGRKMWCTKKGWRNNERKLIAEFKTPKQNVLCFSLCETQFFKDVSLANKDGINYKPTSEVSGTIKVFKCNLGANHASSVKVANKVYDTVTCENSEWKGIGKDSAIISAEEKDGYKFEATCFGAFLFEVNNCNGDDVEAQKTPRTCGELVVTKNKVGCPAGYALIYKDKIYEFMELVGDSWDRVGPASTDEKPKCVLKCRKPNFDNSAATNLITEVNYNYESTSSTATLTCTDPTDLIVSDITKEVKRRIGPIKCDFSDADAKKWAWTDKIGEVVNSRLKNAQKRGDLDSKAHCFKVCHDGVIENSCGDEKDCEKYLFDGNKLECGAGQVLNVDDKDQDKPIVCSAEGWSKEGDTFVLKEHNDAKLKVKCRHKCSAKFRKVDGSAIKPLESGNTLTCPDTNILKYKFEGDVDKIILDDLTCDGNAKWKAGTEVVHQLDVIPKMLTVECIPSCTNHLIKLDCGTRPPTHCTAPDFAANQISCSDKSNVLLINGNKVESTAMQCTKKSFQNADQTIDISRSSYDMKISAACISKCDKDKFVKI